MPFAEALGYVLAVSVFLAVNEALRSNVLAFAVLKMLAASWLLYSALKLWGLQFRTDAKSVREAFTRVLLTTVVNPKAMLVGTVLIPSNSEVNASMWVLTYAVLSTLAGLGWVIFGASLPLAVRRHSYKLTSLVLAGFSMAALMSAVSG